jgi:hypothetical protein
MKRSINTKLSTVGFAAPHDFPATPYNLVHSCVTKYKDTHPRQWHSYGLGWNGLAYRYRAMVEYDRAFTQSIRDSVSPPPEDRYQQGKDLFGFFMNAVSVFECFFYSAYCIASILESKRFPISEPQDLKFYPDDVVKKFVTAFTDDRLSKDMSQCIGNPVYTDMKVMRDVLAHRGSPPRRFYAGGERNGLATMPDNVKGLPDTWQFERPVDAGTTASYHGWISQELGFLMEAAVEFCKQRL